MKSWSGSAGICINEHKEILMVKSFESEGWAIPSGGIEEGESPEECCVREVKEETGYDVKVIEQLRVKETTIKDIKVKTYYFRVEKIGESSGINDPDEIIVEADWKSLSEIKTIHHVYPEDLEFLVEQLKSFV
ncbi:NUDIX hydrolase [Sporosarcina thermotolerans]|uniref:NUDIX hydrolase n=1 Tax=Sporosarcina thermotolerans TaxID=633404 RepID=A0AAW9A924_9BACL|nr:NUDIX hydrolase [Sporosarcina thermotolerans]MDW0117554.1 NUDIX hydrolase [Sporosarcina thermotolerans]WHT49715.1 NUDIX hydrolase [Sporosarcina thermotolerans]